MSGQVAQTRSGGVIVLDETATLPDGAAVFISLAPMEEDKLPYRRYRGTPYTYVEPFAPADVRH